ncbi:MAG: alpha-ketoacid dehydrogenase subunit beta [Bacteriovoracaceae bacterium]|nr:alpha-ketoacid dehydrogenase subunit beta [Bacteriovoracaceae bacterium]
MKTQTLLSAVNDAMMVEMKNDDSIIVFGEDVGVEGGVFRATVDLQNAYGKERCFDSPLAESGIAGTAVGMAINGLKPVIEMQFSGFAWPAFNQIISHVSRFRNRTRGAMSTPMVIRMPYGGGIRALEHHSESMEAIWAHIPGLKVVIPSTPYDAKGLLIAAIRSPDPVIFMEPKRIYRSVKQEVPEDAYTIPLGKAKVVSAGTDVTLVAYGAQMKEAMAAAGMLKKEGISVDLIDLRTIYPYDKETILKSVKKTGRFLVVHEGPTTFGVGAEMISVVTQNCFTELLAPPSRIAGADTIFPLPRAEKNYMITTERIVNKVKALVSYDV